MPTWQTIYTTGIHIANKIIISTSKALTLKKKKSHIKKIKQKIWKDEIFKKNFKLFFFGYFLHSQTQNPKKKKKLNSTQKMKLQEKFGNFYFSTHSSSLSQCKWFVGFWWCQNSLVSCTVFMCSRWHLRNKNKENPRRIPVWYQLKTLQRLS